MIEELEGYYRQHGILATSFTCANREQCAAGRPEFTGPKSAFVSSGYQSGHLPRLLFISLDSGSGDLVEANRLPVAVRQYEEFESSFEGLRKHKHWYRTHELAWYILRHFDPHLEISDARRWFAHANSAKCCMNKPQREKADAILFRNCRGYLSGELAILQPRIVVTQGNEAREAFTSLCTRITQQLDAFAFIVETSLGRHFWLHTYHPSNWGAFNQQRAFDREAGIATGWVRYAALAHEFVADDDMSASDA